MENILELSSLQ